MCWSGSESFRGPDLYLLTNLTSDEMDRGEHLDYHPMSGDPIGDLVFDEERKCFYVDVDPPRYLARIGDGEDHEFGSEFLEHWIYDPYTSWELDDSPDHDIGGGSLWFA